MKRRWRLGLLALTVALCSACAVACGKGNENGEGGVNNGGGVTNVDQTPTKLFAPIVTVDTNGKASWGAVEKATEYEYSLDGGATFTKTSELFVALQAGQTLVVRAVGDGVNYRHSDWSVPVKFGTSSEGNQGGNQGDNQGGNQGDNQGGNQGGDENQDCETCVDSDKNHKCDVCDKELSECADSNNDHKCDVCDKELSQCADSNNDHKCDICDKELSQCADDNKDHKCDICEKELSQCADNDKDHKCDICEKELSQCADNNKDHDCDVCDDKLSDCKDDNKDHDCDICGKELSQCADMDKNHKCDICDKELSQCADIDNNHKCDTCDKELSQCADDNKDGKCDVCGGKVAKPGDDTTGNVLFTGKSADTVSSSSNAMIESVTTPATGVKVTTADAWSTVYITVTKDGAPLTQADLNTYRYLDMKIYSEEAGTRILLLNQVIGTLEQGENTVRVMTWDILTQMTNSAQAYDYTTGAMYFQIWEGNSTLIFEEIVGVVEEKEEVPNGEAGQTSSTMLVNACEGNNESNPIGWYCGTNGQVTEDKTIFSQGTSSYKLALGANNYITTSIRHPDTAPLSVEELLAFDYLALDVYNAETENINLFLYNSLAAVLAPGWNTVKISRDTIAGQIAQSQAAGGVLQYDGSHFYFVVYAACTLYFDNIRGVKEGVVDLGNVFILGDSYSTFEEYIPYQSDAAWYRKTPAYVTNVDKPSETWWWQLLQDTNSNLLVNASYSGTTICNTGYSGVLGEAKDTSFTTRLQQYIDAGYFETNKVDTFFLFGGTNDIWSNHDNKFSIGEPMYEGWTETDLNYILPAFCYLINQIKTDVKPTRLVVIINDELASFDAVAVEKYKEICAHYGVDVVELSGVSKSSGHPDELGMTTIKEQIIAYMNSKQ